MTLKKNLFFIFVGDTDSSEDEDNKYFEERHYSEYGRAIKNMLNTPKSSSISLTDYASKPNISNAVKNDIKWTDSKPATPKATPEAPKQKITELPKFGAQKNDVLLDPTFNMRIVNPVVSSTVLKERMIGRRAISTLKIKNFLLTSDHKETDWVTAGAVVGKFSKTSQKGHPYCLWTISDLLGDIKMVTVFLFGTAYKEFWKTSLGTVVGILNPGVMDSKDNKTEATLRVDNSQKIMILGMSKDYGICKSKRKSGEDCTSVVNKSVCEHCVYHVKQAYNSASRRSDLQSSFAGKGLSLNNLRNKVLGKNEVFYAGKTFTAIPAKKSMKQIQKDEERLRKLSEKPVKKVSNASNDRAQERDNDILRRLSESTPGKSQEQVVNKSLDINRLNVMEKTPKTPVVNKTPIENKIPVLNKTPKMIDLDAPVSRNEKSKAKINALKFIRQNGPIKKEDSGKKKKKSPEQIKALKRKLEMEEEANKKPKVTQEETAEKTGKELIKQKLEKCGITEEFLELMKAPPKNAELLKEAESEEREKYFNKLEIKEKMEEKMLTTYKIECKAVRCLKCNYKSFSASELCKSEKHPLKVVNAMKRFWKCGDCGARTVCLELVPLHSCKVCGSSKWEKTSMMREKKDPNLVREPLSIRGHEEKFIGAAVQNANLNLLVPDDA